MTLQILGAKLPGTAAAAHAHLDTDHSGDVSADELKGASASELHTLRRHVEATVRETDAYVNGTAANRGNAGAALMAGSALAMTVAGPLAIPFAVWGAVKSYGAVRDAWAAIDVAEQGKSAMKALDVMIQAKLDG